MDHTPAPESSLRFFSTAGRLSRCDFARTLAALFGGLRLLVCALASVLLIAAVDLVIMPLCIVLTTLGLLPYNAAQYVFLLAAALYPLAALPLVLRRLRTLGRSPYEAILVYASLLPTPVVSIYVADFFTRMAQYGAQPHGRAGDPAAQFSLLAMEPGLGTLIGAALTVLCAAGSIVGIVRLLQKDDPCAGKTR